jgi:DivIVA domain-containing protein
LLEGGSKVYNDRICLTPNDILEKEFKIDARGFRPQEVDKFLDLVIRDYTEYNSIIKHFEEEKKNLLEENQRLKQEIRHLNEDLELKKNSESNTRSLTNLDLLKRISQLEKAVFGKEE